MVGLPFSIIIAASTYCIHWNEWKRWDDRIQYLIDASVSAEIEVTALYTVVNLDRGNGVSMSIPRRPFEPPITASCHVGLVGGVFSALVSLTTRFIYVAWARRREQRMKGRCRQCGYNLTGNVSGICPECGRPIEASTLPTLQPLDTNTSQLPPTP